LRKWIRKQANGDDLSGVSHYSYVDEQGVFYPGNSANTKPGGYTYDIIHPLTGVICAKPEYGYRWTFATFTAADEKGDVMWGETEKTIPKIKKRLDTVTQKLKSYYYEDNRGTTTELKNLFDGYKVFDNPKSVNFIKHILKFATTATSNDIVLDFFAGSGTTGHAVMQLNVEDGGNRKFILVQIPEPIDPKKNKAACDFVKDELKAEPTIFEITKERIKRASEKVKTEVETTNKKNGMFPEQQKQVPDIGFKIYETTPIWEDYDFEAESFDSSLTLFDVGKLKEDDLKALLVTWKTFDGISLSQDLEIVDLGGYTAYYGNRKLYLLNKNFNTDNLKAILEKIDADKKFNPTSVIAFGYHFESKSLRELAENVKQYANKKKIDIDFITRY